MPKKKVKKVRVQAYLHPTMMQSVKSVADKHGVTVSDVVVATIHMYLSEHGTTISFDDLLEK